MTKKRGFTLVEILVVVSIIALVAGLTIPAIKAMQAGSARAEALNTINAALQGVRSYAIMNQVKAAARFQPNGKVVFVYRFEGKAESPTVFSQAKTLNGTTTIGTNVDPYPSVDSTATPPNKPNSFIYLPVLDQEPLKMPNGYGVAIPSTSPLQLAPPFYEPFYICYNPDGTLAANEPIFVALVDEIGSASGPRPINPDFNGNDNFAWQDPVPLASYNLTNWLNFLQNSNDAASTVDVDDRKLARFFLIANDSDPSQKNAQLEAIFETGDLGIDHYAGWYQNSGTNRISFYSFSSIVLFKTPDDWVRMSLYSVGGTKTKCSEVNGHILLLPTDKDGNPTPGYKPDQYESIYVNPYTGRIIRANQ